MTIMEKKIRFILFFCILHLLSAPILTATRLNSLMDESRSTKTIELPAPENFRITSVSSNSISLAWAPVSFNATYTLEILREDSLNNWNLVTTIYNLPDSTYIATGLTSGTHYRFIIATNDESGEPGEEKSFLDGITLIFELTTLGRTPENPIIQDGCSVIHSNIDWIGFKISHKENAEINNFFEIKVSVQFYEGEPITGVVSIKRALDENIFAVNHLDIWPTTNNSSIHCGSIFKVIQLTSISPLAYTNVGTLKIYLTESEISICIDNQPPLGYPEWNDNYSFSVMSTEKFAQEEGEAIKPRLVENNNNNEKIIVNSIFNANLNIHIPTPNELNQTINIQLYNTKGELFKNYNLHDFDMDFSIPTQELNAGVYILKLKNNNFNSTIKVIKTN